MENSPSPSLKNTLATSGLYLGLGIALACSLMDGSSTHIPAFTLRLVLVVAIFVFWPRRRVICRQWELFTPGLALLSIMAGQAMSSNIGLAIQPSVTALVCIGLYLCLLYTEKNYAETLLKMALLIGLVHSGWALYQWLTTGGRASGGFFNPNNLAALLVPLIVVALYEGLQHRSLTQWLLFSIATLLGLGLACSSSRSGYIALGCSLCILLVSHLGKRALFPILLLGGSIVSALAWRQLNLEHQDPYSLSRIAIWRESIALALKHPFGVGLGEYHRAMQTQGVPLPGWVQYPKIATQAHSELIQAWVEIGWLGLITILSCPLSIGLALHHRLQQNRPIARDLALLVSFAIPALASVTLHVPIIAALASIWAAAVFRNTPRFGPVTSLSLGGSRVPFVGIASFAALLTLVPITVGHYFSNQAVALRAQGRYPQASQAATLAAKWNPWSLGNHLLRESLLFLVNGDPYKASRQVAELSPRFPKDPRPFKRSIWLLDQTSPQELPPHRKSEMKIQLLHELSLRTPKDALVWKQLATLYLASLQENKATNMLERCLDVEPKCADCLSMLADIYSRQGELPKAKRLARMAIDADLQSPKKINDRHSKILSLSPKARKIVLRLAP